MRQALDRLPAHQKDHLMLYHEDELTYEEIAERMQTPAGTIKSRLHRARLNLQQIIKDDPQLMPLAMGS